MSTKTIQQLHSEHTSWLHELDFVHDELICLRDEISMVNCKAGDLVCLTKFEWYLKVLSKELKELLKLRTAINEHEEYLAKQAHKGLHLELDHRKEELDIVKFLENFRVLRLNIKSFLGRTLAT
ncbi:hypothetical protein R9C00_29425 [Flammeovirgaceae bacterium SG7u.111]|nr:hypothetical protein [Flammeovirgaceae bacterium SG7u.132]WPO35821.1 hypothetical protein R9C00_29425 [Flammeovirgaceae bacterium SG7u.111]